MSKRIAACDDDATRQLDLCISVFQRFSAELLPHFREEEANVFPLLRGVHEPELARALHDHETLQALAARLGEGDCTALMQFGDVLATHIRFEERELFPRYEALITSPQRTRTTRDDQPPFSDPIRFPTRLPTPLPSFFSTLPEGNSMSSCAHNYISPDAIYGFDARGIAKRFRHAAIFGALDVLVTGETMRFANDHDPIPLLQQIAARFGRAIIVQYVQRKPGEVIIDFVRTDS